MVRISPHQTSQAKKPPFVIIITAFYVPLSCAKNFSFHNLQLQLLNNVYLSTAKIKMISHSEKELQSFILIKDQKSNLYFHHSSSDLKISYNNMFTNTLDYLDSFQYAATSNLGKTRVAFSKRAMPTPSQNCNHHKQCPFLP